MPISQSVKRLLLLSVLAVFFVGCRPSTPDTPTYRFVKTWGQRGDRPGELREPVAIVVAGDEIFVSDAGNNRIQVFDREGRFLRQFGTITGKGEQTSKMFHRTRPRYPKTIPDPKGTEIGAYGRNETVITNGFNA